jgi:Carboxypeptidase regulatory-like domain
MRSFGVRLPILAATAWAGIGLSVFGRELGYSETIYLTPTVATYALPTSYVTSRAYVVPTTYSFASYLPAAYIEEPVTLASTSYVTTAYQLRRGLFGRLRVVERPILANYATTYLPSSYIVPSYYTTSYRASSYIPRTYSATVFEYPRVWESSYVSRSGLDCEPVPCDTPVLASAYRGASVGSTTESATAPTYSIPRSSNGSKSTTSAPLEDPTMIPSTVGPPPGEPDNLSPVDTAKRSTPANRADSPPKPPAANREQTTAAPIEAAPAAGTQTPTKGATGATPTTKPTPPDAPGADPVEPDLKPAPIDNAVSNRRESLRPVYPTTRTLRPELRNVLVGRVESDSGEPLGEVSISVARVDNRSIQRTGMTNAFGNFAIRLTDGEWNVNVRMPSGRLYKVRTLTVANGAIVDNEERREVRNLIISY